MIEDPVRPIAFELTAEIEIDAPIDVVWRSITEYIGEWWPHSFSDEPKIAIEPWIGGRFWEEFADTGGGALYATVTFLKPLRELTVSGSMGMRGARQYVKTYRLEERGAQTIVRTVASMLGDIDDETRESYTTGGVEVLERLKGHAERTA
jgi:uncharacterized protein YndB with AHSA1/START domain